MSETLQAPANRTRARMSTADLIDQVEALERVKSAVCAVQARLTDELAQQRPTNRGHPAASVTTEIAMARRESPRVGRRKVRLATALLHELPHTYLALCGGDLNEHRAQIIADETADLSREDRLAADAALNDVLFSGEHGCALGDKRLTHKIRSIVQGLDDEAATRRHDKALANRRVVGRLLRDGTAEIKIITSSDKYAAIMASLDKHAAKRRAEGDERTRAQIVSDTAAARLAGHDLDQAAPVAVQLVVSAETLLGHESDPGRIPGHGPIPASVVRRIVAAAHPTRSTIRRLFAVPHDQSLITMESEQRRFTAGLRDFLTLRDDLCRTPWCNAPIRHADHAIPHSRGGPTTAINGQGLCEWCNYVKDQAGWRHRPGPDTEAHRIDTTTPTGHRHRSREPGVPTPRHPRHGSPVDIMIRDYIDFELTA